MTCEGKNGVLEEFADIFWAPFSFRNKATWHLVSSCSLVVTPKLCD